MLESICRALEDRDRTHGHGERVAALSERVAARLDWSADRLARLRYGAMLHDVGKVVVRVETLRKAGPLTPEELAEIRSHPEAGATLINELRWAEAAIPCVLWHHERWDGGGYPWGLCRSAIPLEARIVAVADAFDAMTSVRPYRAARTREQALAEVEAGAGTQFDPVLAELFVEAWAEVAAA
jgi:HD-GYP domain-containing protein (c-di-GMP phosphodiesterase class II)